MRIELGARVRTSDEQDAGTIDRLIVDPEQGTVNAAVVRKGFILTRDVEIPFAMLTIEPDGDVRLTLTADQMEELPDFIETKYATPPLEYAPRAGYPATGLYWPTTYGMPDEAPAAGDAPADEVVSEAIYRQHVENAVVGEGSEVKSKAGETVGQVRLLTFDADSGQLTGVVMRRGILNQEEVELPASLVMGIDDGIVYLSLDAHDARIQPG